ncbi:hypothetical protein B5S28_g5066 [[Candida] boidinii]|nr:hypothetical protein B5S28_g5066 [[Candida] boidinii]
MAQNLTSSDSRISDSVTFYLSEDIKASVKIKILSIEGFSYLNSTSKFINDSLNQYNSSTLEIVNSKLKNQAENEIFSSVYIVSSSIQLTIPLVTNVKYIPDKNPLDSISNLTLAQDQKSMSASTIINSIPWYTKENILEHRLNNGWITLPINYSQLPLDAKLKITFHIFNPKTGKKIYVSDAETSLFNLDSDESINVQRYTLKKGNQKICMNIFNNEHNNRVNSKNIGGNNIGDNNKNNNSSNSDNGNSTHRNGASDNDDNKNDDPISEMERLEKLLKLKETNDQPSIGWLEQMTYRKIEQINHANSESQHSNPLKKKKCTLHIEFPSFDFPVVYSDSECNIFTIPTSDTLHHNNRLTNNNRASSEAMANKIIYDNRQHKTYFPTILDVDQYRNENSEDPIEVKFRKIERNHQTSPMDKDSKPSLKVKNELTKSLKKQFFETLSRKEKNMIWRYRFYLLNTFILNKNTMHLSNFIINFIKCIDWDDDYEVKEFLTIISDLDRQKRNRLDERNAMSTISTEINNSTNNLTIGNDNVNSANNISKQLQLTSLNGNSKTQTTSISNNNISNRNGTSISSTNSGIFNNMNSSTSGIPQSSIFIQELEIVDCLELLSANYKSHIVRNMAVERLKMASDEELEMYMVQLVRCIKNESNYINPNSINDESIDIDEIYDLDSSLGSNINSSSSDFQIISEGTTENPVFNLLNNPKLISKSNQKRLVEKISKINSPLAGLLIERSISNFRLTSFFYWTVQVEADDEKEELKNIDKRDNLYNDENGYYSNRKNSKLYAATKRIYQRTLLYFVGQLASSANGIDKIITLKRQVEFVTAIHDITAKIKINYKKESTPKKIEILRNLLHEKKKYKFLSAPHVSSSSVSLSPNKALSSIGNYRKSIFEESNSDSMLNFPPIPLPIDPQIEVTGLVPEGCSVFKSSMSPLKLTMKVKDNSLYRVMYKIGDDLRQDQFVVQIITLMDKILKNENLDLKLKPYKIVALGSVEGFIEFVPNSSLSSILAQYNNSILTFLQLHNPDPTAPHSVKPEAMDNYVRSCAGYCVITYILGVGDRHLENLLMTTDGYFFHADFGYILGEDPKPFPPLMKLPIQIIEGMGGLNDENYNKFCNYCFIAYITLRRNASLILNLFQLMINSSIPALRTSSGGSGPGGANNMIDSEISNENEKLEIIWKIQEKFMLELNDEEAILHFQNLINDSVNAFLPVVIDRLHSLAQYWRA